MKSSKNASVKIGKYTIYHKQSIRGWAIIIMPNQVRIDNFHGFHHIHYTLKGKHNEIKENNFNNVLKIVIKHITSNKEINKEKLKEELSK